MNERIRELACQAGFETEHHKWIFANDDAGEGECHELLEKFAELIVRECIDIASQEDFDVMMKEGYPCSQTAKKITQHFGVEE